ncbi:MAG: enoyl-CoA hydratase [Thiothrix nivea]|nr:MAG: enoyl-CoA hydratase [Thiothrix nivea]
MTEQRMIAVGDTASLTRTFTEEDVRQFAELSGDYNPVHLDAEFAAASQFGQRIVHGILVTSLFSTLLGTELPGKGAIYMTQNSQFRAPVNLDEEVTATVEVLEINEKKPVVTLKTTATNATGKVVIQGEAMMFVPWLKK